jgi:hypothetical protein
LPYFAICNNVAFFRDVQELVAYATIVDATIFAQEAKVHDPGSGLAKNLSGFQKSVRCGCARLPVAMGSYPIIRFSELSNSYFDLRNFSATFSAKYETFSLNCGLRPVQVAN